MQKTVQLCADDYGQNMMISQSICYLIAQKKLTATSCLVDAPDWPAQAALLRPMYKTVDIGLHFNLTEALSAQQAVKSLPFLLLASVCRVVSKQMVLDALTRQWDLFVAQLGFEPDFIDGHQHVHQFPVIQDVVLGFLSAKNFKGWVRVTTPTVAAPHYGFKGKLLQVLGGQQFLDKCNALQLKHHTAFAGFYDFSPNINYQTLMQYWLTHAPDGALIMCHPADLTQANRHDTLYRGDVIAAARQKEYQYLNSDAFNQDCARLNTRLFLLDTKL